MKRKSKQDRRLFRDARVLYVVMLTMLFQCIYTGMAYAQNDNTVVQGSASQSKKRITGKVTNAAGESLIGASVGIRNTSVGTATNNEGLYVIDALPTDVLTFSYAGYVSRDTSVNGTEGLNMVLEREIQMGERVIVVGYGKQKRAAMVSSVSSVTAKELMVPTGNITGNLAGQLSGLIAIQ